MPKSPPVEAPGIILVHEANAEILRRQCEASAHSCRDSLTMHKVQLILLREGEVCIRMYGSFTQFRILLHRLKFPDSGWKPHQRFTGWWKQKLMLQPAPKYGFLLQSTPDGACTLLDIRDSRQKKHAACQAFRSVPLNPDTLQFLECVSFE